MLKLSKITLISLACLSASISTLTAFADSTDADFDNPVAGVYFGAMGGMTSFDITSGDQSRTVSGQAYEFTPTKENFTGNVHAGSLWGLNNDFSLGAELGATYWGSYKFEGSGATTGSASYAQETANMLFDFQWNVTSRIFLMPQIGVAINIGSASGALTAGGVAVEGGVKYKLSPLVGLNLGFNVTPALSLYLSGQRLMGESFDSSYEGFNQRLLESTALNIGFNYNIGE